MNRVAMALCGLAMASTAALAGPPFQTDDPEPIEYKNYEVYTFAAMSSLPGEVDTQGPAIEFNWGALPNVHLHLIIPAESYLPVWAQQGFGPWTTDGGGGEVIVQVCFQQELNKKLSIATEVFYHGQLTVASRHSTLVDLGGYYKFHGDES